MTPPITQLPLQGTMAGFRRFSVAEYHKLIEIGILTEDDDLELIEGYLVHKMTRNPPHDNTLLVLNRLLILAVPGGWVVRPQSAITLAESEPEPDLVVARGDLRTFRTRHPAPADIGLVVEVAHSTLASDRSDKLRIYARAGIGLYWIVNLVDDQVEVYTAPSGPTAAPTYGHRKDYGLGDAVPFALDGQTVAQFAVADLVG